MKLDHRIISADDHVLESKDTWTARMSQQKWGDRIPHVEALPEGDVWSVDGKKIGLTGRGSVSAALGDRTRAIKRWAEIPPAAYVPAERLRALDADGVAYSVLYPLVAGFCGETLSAIPDLEFQLACVQAYNDWLIEEWAAASRRFIPQCIVPLASSEAMSAEIRRAVAKGHRGALLPMVPSLIREDAPELNDPCYNAVWQTCEDLDIPLCLHAGVSDKLQLQAYEGYSPAVAQAFEAIVVPQSNPIGIANLLVSQILERHTRLKVVFSGAAAGWINYLLETLENNFNNAKVATLGYKRQPIDQFKQQCFIVATHENGRSLRHVCDSPGAQNILWGSEFPLANSTWPQSRWVVDSAAGALSESDREMIFAGNAAALYKVSVRDSVPA